jgi:hypothetical protein|tara:strand:+ start:279 stop:491 length:213 start_codon:yes stop_codon:yes gene_type:complete
MQTNPAGMLYHSMNRRLEKEAENEKPKPVLGGLLSKSPDRMQKKEDGVGQPLERVASYMKMIRDKKEQEV